jgi:iron complex transport system substrate-binding protein
MASARDNGKLRVVSLLPAATDTLSALVEEIPSHEDVPFDLCGCSHECDIPGFVLARGHPPAILTASRLGDIPIDDIQLAFSSSTAAVQEFTTLCQPLAVPLLQYGLSAYQLDIETLQDIKPDVILTCLQTAHSCILEGELADMAFQSVLGYCPRIVHAEGQTLEDVYGDMVRIADAVMLGEAGRVNVAEMKKTMEYIGASLRQTLADDAVRIPSVSVIQWATPVFPAGAWVLDMMELLGVKNAGGEWEGADVVVWCLCGLGVDVAEREARKVVGRVMARQAGRTRVTPASMAVMDGVRMMSRPGPLLVESMKRLAEVVRGATAPGTDRKDAAIAEGWKWLNLAYE